MSTLLLALPNFWMSETCEDAKVQVRILLRRRVYLGLVLRSRLSQKRAVALPFVPAGRGVVGGEKEVAEGGRREESVGSGR